MNEYLQQVLNSVRGLFGGSRDKAMEQVQKLTRQTMIARAFAFFNGFMPKQLQVKAGEPDDNIAINYASVIVDKGVAFLFGQPLVLSIGTDEDKRGEEFIERVWSQAQRDEEFQEMAEDGAISGDAYLKINIEPDGTPRVTVGDPNTYQIITDQHDVARIVKFICSYQLDGDSKPYLFKEETVRAGDGKSWQIDQYVSYDGGKVWTPLADKSVKWNFSFPPIFHAKNLPNPRCSNGKPDLTEDVLSLIAYISRLDSMCGKIVRIHSSPKPYAKNLKKQDLEWGTDGMLFLKPTGTTAEAEIKLLEMQNDIATALSLRKVLREALAEVTGVPEVATGKVETTGQLSGVALRILYGPLLDKTSKKQLRYGRMIKECAQALLVIGNLKALTVKLNWPDPLPGDEKEKVDVAEGKKRLGVSQATLQKELGYDPEHEREQRQFDAQEVGAGLLDAFNSGGATEGAIA